MEFTPLAAFLCHQPHTPSCPLVGVILMLACPYSEIARIDAVDKAVGALSFIGSLSIIACYFAFPSLQKLAFTLVLFLSIADVLAAIGDFIAPNDSACAPCLVQAYFRSVFDLASVLWTACITHCLFRAIRHRDTNVERFQLRYHAFSWGLPVVLALVPQFANAYGYENGGCWIMSTHPSLRFLQFYVPLWIVIGYNVYHMATLVSHLRELTQNADTQFFWRLALYPVILIVCWTPGTVNRIHNSLNPLRPNFGLYVAHAVMGSSQGLLNCLVYGLSPGVRSNLVAVVRDLLNRCGFAGGSGAVLRGDARAGHVELKEVEVAGQRQGDEAGGRV